MMIATTTWLIGPARAHPRPRRGRVGAARHRPPHQRELSQILKCTPRNVTGLVDALQTAGFVERPADELAAFSAVLARVLARLRANYDPS